MTFCTQLRKALWKLSRLSCSSCAPPQAYWFCLQRHALSVQLPLELWKADIDSAFRRVPLCPEQRKFAAIAFKHKGKVLVYIHNAMPFGAIASVHAWDRIGTAFSSCSYGHCKTRYLLQGCLLSAIARRLLHIPVMRYVDDYFGIESQGTAKSAMSIFARWTELVSLVACNLACTCICKVGQMRVRSDSSKRPQVVIWQPAGNLGHRGHTQSRQRAVQT